MRIESIAAWWTLAIVLGLPPATALDPHTRITQYFHTAWRVQDGAFDAVPSAVTQTADGYIWIGTGSGLVKFDGVRFQPWAPPPGKSLPDPTVISLRGSSDGTLWIGTTRGLVSWKNNDLREHLQNRINAIVEDRKGRIWVARGRASSGGLCQVTGERPGCFGADDRMKLPFAAVLAEDVHGYLWVGGSTQLLRWHDGSFDPYFREQLASRRRPIGVDSVAAAPDGSVWVSVPSEKSLGLLHIVDGRAKRVNLEGVKKQEFTTVFVDRVGALWLATANDGLYRSYNGRVDHFGSRDGLSSETVGNFFEDREGNLWVTTSKGLEFFRDSRVVTFSTSEGLSSDYAASVLAAADGTVWVGNRHTLDAIHEGKVTSIPIPGQRVTALWEDHARRLWVGIDNLLTVYERGRFNKVNLPNGSPAGVTTAIGEDREQNIWAVANPEHKLFRIRDMRVEEELGPPKIPNPRLVTADPSGGVWLAFTDKFIGHYRNGKLDLIGQISATGLVAEADGSVWASTRAGLVHWKDGRTQTLTSKNGLRCDTIYSAIRDNRRTLWLYTACGLIGIADSELDRWLRDPASLIQSKVLDALDGARPSSSTFQPAASKSPDGRLWFANEGTVQMFDPNRLTQDRPAPPVYVERVRADRREYGVDEFVRLPPHPREIEISYTALSYSIPQRVRFRYKLQPRDEDWQDAGTRRQAFYSDLRPGRYRFHVTASNSDGVWNESGSALEFSIAPAYYQTTWFYASCVAAFLAVLWGLYRLRVYQIRREFNAQLDGRVDERLRVARELHDTLLQSFQAALIRMQVARNVFARRPEKAVEGLDDAISMASGAVAEGRNAIQNLRAQPAGAGDLAQLLTATGQELAQSEEGQRNPPVFRLTVEGERRELEPLLQDEVYRIARELLRNAFRHAQAGRIEAEIRYESCQLRVHVRDDGKGIDPQVLKAGGRAGHWGLPGMQERAGRFGGKLEFWSEAAAGTEVVLTVPAAAAYGVAKGGSFSFLRRKKDRS